MKPIWYQCIWWQLKDTLNGNIHNAISFHSTFISYRAPFAMAALTTKIIAIVPNKLSTDRDLNGIVKNYTGTKYCEIYREASPQTADDIRDPCIEFTIWHLFFQSKHWRGRRGAVEMISNFFCDQNLSLNGVELFPLKMARWYLSVIWNTTQCGEDFKKGVCIFVSWDHFTS